MIEVTTQVLVIAAISVPSAVWAAPACNNLKGDWVNQLKSTLSITSIDASTGRIEGTYTSPSGTGGESHTLIGWVNSAPSSTGKDNVPVVSFSVQWGGYGSITSWTGYCSIRDGAPTITTLWNLTQANSKFSWDHIVSNSDLFTPKP
jgi:hypothetical protein